MLSEHEKQVYHEFLEITDEVYNDNIVPEGYPSKYDTYKLITNGPRGMDPCQSFW